MFVSAKLPRLTGLTTSSILMLAGLIYPLYPYMGSIWPYYLLQIAVGFLVGYSFPALNVLLLEIWREDKSAGPYMHSFHLCYNLGGICAPFFIKPFISGREVLFNGIKTYYPMLGAIIFLLGLLFLPMGIRKYRRGALPGTVDIFG